VISKLTVKENMKIMMIIVLFLWIECWLTPVKDAIQ